MNLLDLAKPFSPAVIKWRVGSTNKKKWDYAKKNNQQLPEPKGMPLAYLDARDVQDRLDEVCGLGGWQCRNPWSESNKLSCEIGIKVGEEWLWLWRGDGAGETAVEGEKGAFSDAFKRAGVRWGIGRYLYDLPNTWVTLDDYWRLPKSEVADLSGRLATWQQQRYNQSDRARVILSNSIDRCESIRSLRNLLTTSAKDLRDELMQEFEDKAEVFGEPLTNDPTSGDK
jgi:hypothetical protein